jgi:hypothetical protein
MRRSRWRKALKKYDTAKLIEFLRGQDLGFDEDDEKIIRKEKINGQDLLNLTERNFAVLA